MKGRESKGGLPPADLLVCFPTRTHLSLLPKPICSPARGSDPTKRHHKHRMVKKTASRGSHGSPLLWARTKSMESEMSEPTSPKVTCAGQIKVRPKTAATCKSWQSVMEEIERIHNDGKNRKRLGWVDVIGFKKDVMQFLTCLRSIKFDFRCFRAFPESDITTDDEDEEEEEEDEDDEGETTATSTEGKEKSNDVFSKWFMVLQEDQKNEFSEESKKENNGSFDDGSEIKAPPANALLLMRCRSAPAKSWREEEQEEEAEEEEEEEEEKEKEKEERKSKSLRTLIEEDNKTIKKNKLLITNYDSDSYKISSDVVKETWIVGGLTGDSLSRSRSWKRW